MLGDLVGWGERTWLIETATVWRRGWKEAAEKKSADNQATESADNQATESADNQATEKRGQSGNGKARTTSARDKMKRRKLGGMNVDGESQHSEWSLVNRLVWISGIKDGINTWGKTPRKAKNQKKGKSELPPIWALAPKATQRKRW